MKVEELDSDDLPPVGKLTGLLIKRAYAAQSPFTRPRTPIPEQVMADERKLFADRVPQLAGEQDSVAPIPYRRTLSDEEGERWLASLQQRWGVVKHEWHPMLATAVPDDVLVLRQDGLFQGGGEAAGRAGARRDGGRAARDRAERGPRAPRDRCCVVQPDLHGLGRRPLDRRIARLDHLRVAREHGRVRRQYPAVSDRGMGRNGRVGMASAWD